MADSKLKKLEDVIKDLQDYMGPKATLGKIKDILGIKKYKSPKLRVLKAKGGIVKKNKGGLMVKPKAAKRGY